MSRATSLYRRMASAPKRQATKDRQRIDKAIDTMTSEESEFFQRLSPDAKKKFLQTKSNLKKMSPAERRRFYQENSIWVSEFFDYRDGDDGLGEFLGKNQLGKKVNAFLRATQKQYTLNDMKKMAKYRAKSSRVKTSRPKKSSSKKLTLQQVDAQIADLERQLDQLKTIRKGLIR